MQIQTSVRSTKELESAVAEELKLTNKPEITIAQLLNKVEEDEEADDEPECG